MNSKNSLSNDDLLRNAWKITRSVFPPELHVFHPGMFRINGKFGKYPAISITGQNCNLLCHHCNGRLLRGMADGSTTEKFLRKCFLWNDQNLPGILISGGSDLDGRLPWHKYIPLIKKIKCETNLHISIHIGLADPDIVKKLSDSGVDTIMFDLVPSQNIYTKVFKIKNGYSRMYKMLTALESIQVAPHIILGLDSGKVVNEYSALDLIENLNISTLVIIQFTPLYGTKMYKEPTASNKDIVNFIATCRLRFNTTEISLGCARKRPDSHLEIQSIQAGINRIALPEQETINYAEQMGLNIVQHPVCCSVAGLKPILQQEKS